MIEPDTDVAAVRRGIQGFRDPKHPTKALDALDRLAARLQEAERERAALREALVEMVALVEDAAYRPLDYPEDAATLNRARGLASDESGEAK